MDKRLCVFCGQEPIERNKEHVLSRWLLELTGDPNRTVKFCQNYITGKTVEFAWSQLVVPACVQCNSEFGEELEGHAARIVRCCLNRESVSVADHILLLDWLDKVRVGLWLNYQLINGNPAGVKPNFRIKDRIAKKDRMVGIYTFDTDQVGLNAYGVETLAFNTSPSCMALRVNSVIFFNMSSDYLFAGRCGFPNPGRKVLYLDGEHDGKMSLTEFTTTRRIENQILEQPLIKPTIQLFQPIMQPDTTGRYAGGFMGAEWRGDRYIEAHTFDDDTSKGVIFRQHANRVSVLNNLNAAVELEKVVGGDMRPMGHVVAQVYQRQIAIIADVEPVAVSEDRIQSRLKYQSLCQAESESAVKALYEASK